MSTIPTPPPTSLSPAPSPTAREELPEPELPSSATSPMPPSKFQLSRPIYLIVATTVSPPLGIGINGSLPWGPLRADIAFFKRVTSDSLAPKMAVPDSSGITHTGDTVINAVVMGRKTWESIPPRFRPLQGRLNIVLKTGDTKPFVEKVLGETLAKETATMNSSGMPEASNFSLSTCKDATFVTNSSSPTTPVMVTNSLATALEAFSVPNAQPALTIGTTFVIGGSEIYRAALSTLPRDRPVRILQTQVRRRDGASIECDTFFAETLEKSRDWAEASRADVEAWTGTDLLQGEQEWKVDGDKEIRVLGWERRR